MKRTMILAGLALVACSESKTNPTNVTPPPSGDAVTYQKDLRALIEQNCQECHQDDGIGPFNLNSYEDLKAVAPAVVGAVTTKSMPPWMPDPSCRQFRGERHLSDAEIQLFTDWMDDGQLEGDEADYTAPGEKQSNLSLLEMLGPPDADLAASEPYSPSADRPDDYRCFILDHDFENETFMTASNIVPDRSELVHHVIVFLIEPPQVPQVVARDEREAGEGYTCFGGAGAGNPIPIIGWVPGNVPTVLSSEALIRIPAGSKLVMQMHYNMLGAPSAPDQTRVNIWLTEERPEYLLSPVFFPHLGIDIEAGDPASVQTREIENTSNQPWTIVSTSPHMHLLGTRLKTVKVATDGTEECMVDIPNWDFNWQQGYAFREGEEVVVMPGERIRLECTYDNSAANQPVVNGEQLEPKRVRWGEGTLDEMCLNTLTFVEPYTPYQSQPSNLCEGFQTCYDGCAGGIFPMTGCIMQCGATNGCANCLLTGIITCTSSDCGPRAQAMLDCLDGCEGEADFGACVTNQCGTSILSFDQCARPLVEAGQCDAEVSACNDVTLY